jgi:predicted RNA-binding Zn-ribbon protein involved in translation (DUF1610 family)
MAYCKKCGKELSLENKPLHRNDICEFCLQEEDKTRYCKECGEELKAFNLTAYSKYLCPDCDESEHECFTGKGP